jgi:hypothetical protein
MWQLKNRTGIVLRVLFFTYVLSINANICFGMLTILATSQTSWNKNLKSAKDEERKKERKKERNFPFELTFK